MLLKNGDTGVQVKYLQYGLRIMCCSPGAIDSIYGSGTQAAVMKFQKAWGLTEDGIVGDVTWNCLVKEIQSIQQALKNKGFFADAITGIAKETTYNAVLNFQSSKNLTADGMVGAATRSKLFSENTESSENTAIPLQNGSRGDYVLNLQYGLRIMCCSPGAMDGIFGAGTAAAVKKYQGKYGITETGICDSLTWSHLKAQIKKIQQRLLELGFAIADTDGLATSALVESIKKFQSEHQLTADGQVGPATISILFSDNDDAATDALPLARNSRGPRVLYFQYALRINCINPNGTDGIFGAGTESAVNRYKVQKGFEQDGQVDITTWEKMREDIRPIQTALANRGYKVGYVDGIAREETYNAVLQYQRDNGLTSDGMVGTATKNLLMGSGGGTGTISSTLKKGSNGSLTRYLQMLLKQLGYTVTENGLYDTPTEEAVVMFQKNYKLDPDGIVGGGTWRALFDVYRVAVVGTDVERFIQVAEHELAWGFAEDNANNITPYGQWYGMNGNAWCAMFVSYCAYQAGVMDDLVPQYAWCPSGMVWYQNRNRYHKRNSSYIPKKGDVIFFYNNELGRVAHTGIVIDGDEDYITTIEGNTVNDAVEKRTYGRNHATIDGYGDNGGASIAAPWVPSDGDYERAVRELILETLASVGVALMPAIEPVENVDLPIYWDANMRLTFKCSRGSSWYENADSIVQMNFEYGKPSLGVDITPNLSVALEGVQDKEMIGTIITGMAMTVDNVPVKIEYSIDGEWQKLSIIVESTIFKGEHHEETVSYGFTVWSRNVPDNEFAPVMAEAYEYSYEATANVIGVAAVGILFTALVIAAVVFGGAAGSVGVTAATAGAIVLTNVKNQPVS